MTAVKVSPKERVLLRAAQDGRLVCTDGGFTWIRSRTECWLPVDVSELAAELSSREVPLLALGDRDGAWLRRWRLTEVGAATLQVASWDGDFPLVLETRQVDNQTPMFGIPGGGIVAMSPVVGEDYWSIRVKVGGGQAIVGFPKFSTVGVGFAVEPDDSYDVNLPYTSGAYAIWAHIRDNKGDESIPDSRCFQAVTMVVQAARDMVRQGAL